MTEEEKMKDKEQKTVSEKKKTVSSGTLKNIVVPVITTVLATGISYYLFFDKKPPDDDIVPPKVPAGWKNLKPTAIKAYLDEYIIGQEEAKIDACVTSYTHLKTIVSDKPLPANTLLFVGPTGSGKTTMVKHLAESSKMPVCSINATSLTQTGYVGEDLKEVIAREVFRQCRHDIDSGKAPVMIVVIDEFDKLKMQPRNNGPDIGGESVQNQLLQFEQGATIQYSPKNYHRKTIKFSTKNMMFIYLGAFSNLQNNPQLPNNNFQPNRHINIAHEAIRQYGFKKELVGRISIISQLEPPTTETLVKILEEPKDSIIQKYKNWFEMEGIELSFVQEAKEYIATVALNLALGARGLNNIISQVLRQHMYDVPSQQAKQDITITKDDVELIFPSQGVNVP